MSKIKKQILLLYVISVLESFKLAGASWVALLASRGFSMLEIGAAESIFHIASLLFEVPSGVISDVFGRKRSMMLCHGMFVLSACTMMLSESFPGVAAAMVMNALAYNFASGSREALAYDSLKEVGQEEKYASFSSWELMIYRIGNAAATLLIGLALALGWQRAYGLDVGMAAVCLFLSWRLREPFCSGGENQASRRNEERMSDRIVFCFRESFAFIMKNPKAMKLMGWNALVGASATLTLYFLQAKLPEAGMNLKLLGPALFLMSLGGAAGAKAAPFLSGWTYRRVSLLCFAGVVLGFMASLAGIPGLMIAGGFLGAFFDDLIQVRTDIRLNGMVPSGQRATLLSISSLCFSGVMIVLSVFFGSVYGM